MKQPLPIEDPFGPEDVPQPWTLHELARFHQLAGLRVRDFRGRPWVGSRSGYWTPAMAEQPLPKGEIGWPSQVALGYQAVAAEESVTPLRSCYLTISDLATYGPHRLDRHRRRELRVALTGHEMRVLQDPELLLEQGWEVLEAAAARNGQWRNRSAAAFASRWKRAFERRPPLVVAAIRDGRLQGYIASCAVGAQASGLELVIAPWARPLKTGTALYWAALRLWSHVSGVVSFSAGRATPELAGIDAFKLSMGAEPTMLPVISGLRAPVRAYLRRARPLAYERLYGVSVGEGGEREHPPR